MSLEFDRIVEAATLVEVSGLAPVDGAQTLASVAACAALYRVSLLLWWDTVWAPISAQAGRRMHGTGRPGNDSFDAR